MANLSVIPLTSNGLLSFHLLDSIRLPSVSLRGPLVVRCLDQADKRWIQAKCFVTDDSLYLLINNNNVPTWIRIILTHVQVQFDTSISSSNINDTEYFEVASSRKTYTFKAPNHQLAKQWVTSLQTKSEIYNDNNLIETPEYLISDLLETRYLNPLIDTLNSWWDTVQKRYIYNTEFQQQLHTLLTTTVEKSDADKVQKYLSWLITHTHHPNHGDSSSSSSASGNNMPPSHILRLLRGNIQLSLVDTLLPPVYPLRKLIFRLYSQNNKTKNITYSNEGTKKQRSLPSKSSSLVEETDEEITAFSKLLDLFDSSLLHPFPTTTVTPSSLFTNDFTTRKSNNLPIRHHHRQSSISNNERRTNTYFSTLNNDIDSNNNTKPPNETEYLYNELLWGTLPMDNRKVNKNQNNSSSSSSSLSSSSTTSNRLLPGEIPITFSSSSTSLYKNIPVVLLEASALAGTDISCLIRTFQIKDRRKYMSRYSRKQHAAMYINDPSISISIPSTSSLNLFSSNNMPNNPPQNYQPSTSLSSSTSAAATLIPSSQISTPGYDSNRSLNSSWSISRNSTGNSLPSSTLNNSNNTAGNSNNPVPPQSLTIQLTSDPVTRITSTSLSNFLNSPTVNKRENISSTPTEPRNNEIDGFVVVSSEDLGENSSTAAANNGTTNNIVSVGNPNPTAATAADRARLRKAWMNWQ